MLERPPGSSGLVLHGFAPVLFLLLFSFPNTVLY